MIKKKKPLGIIGWRERPALPDLKISSIKAKIDTGAATSSLHASDYQIYNVGKKRVIRFKVHVTEGSPRKFRWATENLLRLSRVRSSSGHVSERPVITTRLKLGDITFEIELNLINRSDMGFPMLIGRKAIKGRFLVSAGRSFRLTQKV